MTNISKTPLNSRKGVNPGCLREGTTPSTHTNGNSRATSTFLLITVLLVAGFLAYAQSFRTAMVLDDHQFILNDPAIRMTDFSWDALKTAAIDGHPRHRYLPNISFAVNYYFGRLNPFGYHVVNLCIHLLSGIFLFGFIKNTLQLFPDKKSATAPKLIAFFAAMIWIVQPVGSQAVTYICQRMASMVALFYILSLFLYVKGRMAMTGGRNALPDKSHEEPDTVGTGFITAQNGNNDHSQFLVPGLYFAGSALAVLCALATKENAGTLPLIILLYEWFFFQDLKLRWSRQQILWGGFFIIVFCGAVIWYMGENPLVRLVNSYRWREFNMLERVMTEFRIVAYYISLFLWPPPGRLNLDHDYPLSVSPLDPFTTFLAFFALIGLFVLSVYAARNNRLMAFAILWFFITQATESTIIGIELIFEHRTYIPFMMVSLILVLMVLRTFQNRTAALALIGTLILIFSAWTFQRNLHWQNPVTFWQDCVIKSPSKWRPNYNLAKTLYDTGNIEASFVQYKKTVQLHPDHVHSLNNLANILLAKNRIDEAILYLRRSLEIAPDEIAARVNLGNALAKKGLIDDAVAQYQLALNQNPIQKEIYMNLGKALVRGEKWRAAIAVYKRGLDLFPDYPELRLELANAMALGGKPAEALYHYERLRQIPRIAPLAVKNRNSVLATIPEAEQVRSLFKTALRFAAEKNFNPAIGLLQRILAVTPENSMIYYNIACLYALKNDKKQAMDWLHRAVEKGYDDWDHMETDPDLDNIRNEPEYIKLKGKRLKTEV